MYLLQRIYIQAIYKYAYNLNFRQHIRLDTASLRPDGPVVMENSKKTETNYIFLPNYFCTYFV